MIRSSPDSDVNLISSNLMTEQQKGDPEKTAKAVSGDLPNEKNAKGKDMGQLGGVDRIAKGLRGSAFVLRAIGSFYSC